MQSIADNRWAIVVCIQSHAVYPFNCEVEILQAILLIELIL